jgi:hypothetical protein
MTASCGCVHCKWSVVSAMQTDFTAHWLPGCASAAAFASNDGTTAPSSLTATVGSCRLRSAATAASSAASSSEPSAGTQQCFAKPGGTSWFRQDAAAKMQRQVTSAARCRLAHVWAVLRKTT